MISLLLQCPTPGAVVSFTTCSDGAVQVVLPVPAGSAWWLPVLVVIGVAALAIWIVRLVS
jgi:hypothetical protein